MEYREAESLQGSKAHGVKTFCLILARGGSKGILKKNIYPLRNRPLIAYSIEAGLHSRYIDTVYVSTDDDEIAEVAHSCGAVVIRRPENLSQDTSSSGASALHAVKHIQKSRKDTFFVMLQCTSPLRNSSDVDQSVELYLKSDTNCLVSVCKAEHHPYKTFLVKGQEVEFTHSLADFEKPRQILDEAYRTNGAIYIRQISDFISRPQFMVMPFHYYVMDGCRSLDIDSIEDIHYAEYLLAQI